MVYLPALERNLHKLREQWNQERARAGGVTRQTDRQTERDREIQTIRHTRTQTERQTDRLVSE